MAATAHEAFAAKSCSSLSIKSDDSDFEFGSWQSCGQEPPASPRLRCSSPTWESSASKYTVSPARPSETRFVYAAAAPTVYLIHEPVSSSKKSSALVTRHDRDGVNDQLSAAADGTGTSETSRMRSGNSVDTGLKKRENLRSLMLQRRELDQLPPLASPRSAGLPQKTSKKGSASPSPSPSPALQEASSPAEESSRNAKKSSRWSVGMDFLTSKRASSSNGQHLGGAESDAAVGSHGCSEGPESCRQSASSCSSEGTVEQESEDVIGNGNKKGGQPEKAKQCGSAPVSPSASPSRAAAAQSAAGNRQATPPSSPRVNAPMSPHAQHYEHQRARAQNLKRKTFLPYRHNILGSCFFPPPSPVTSC